MVRRTTARAAAITKKKFEVTMAAASQPRSKYKRQPNHLIETTSKLQLQTACSETLNPIDE
jgi:hypothetical protein